jgi:hypothetical protein
MWDISGGVLSTSRQGVLRNIGRAVTCSFQRSRTTSFCLDTNTRTYLPDTEPVAAYAYVHIILQNDQEPQLKEKLYGSSMRLKCQYEDGLIFGLTALRLFHIGTRARNALIHEPR